MEYLCYLDYKICIFLGKCSVVAPRLDPIKIQFSGDKLFTVPAEDYTSDVQLEIEQNGMRSLADFCRIGVSSLDKNIGASLYIIGDAFLRSYLSIYDFDTYRVGLGIHRESKATIEQAQARPGKGGNLLVIIMGSCGVVAVVVGIVVYCRV